MPESASPALAVAANLRRLSRERGLSLSEIARRAEVHRTHVSLILRGRRMVQIDTVVKLAGALGVEPGELLAGIAWVSGDQRLHRAEPRSPGSYRAVEPPPRPKSSDENG